MEEVRRLRRKLRKAQDVKKDLRLKEVKRKLARRKTDVKSSLRTTEQRTLRRFECWIPECATYFKLQRTDASSGHVLDRQSRGLVLYN